MSPDMATCGVLGAELVAVVAGVEGAIEAPGFSGGHEGTVLLEVAVALASGAT